MSLSALQIYYYPGHHWIQCLPAQRNTLREVWGILVIQKIKGYLFGGNNILLVLSQCHINHW